MSIRFYTGNLAKSELETLTALDASGDYLGAFKSLVVEGHYNEAYHYGLNHQLYTEVALLAASQNDLDAVKSACAGTKRNYKCYQAENRINSCGDRKCKHNSVF